MSALKHSLSADMLYPKSDIESADRGSAMLPQSGGRYSPQTQAMRRQQHAKYHHYAHSSKLVKQSDNLLQTNDISRLNVSFEDRDYLYLEDNTMCKDNNANFTKSIKYNGDYDRRFRGYGNEYVNNDLAYKAYMSDNEGTREFNRYRRSIPALPNNSYRHNFGYENFRILSPEEKREAFVRNSYSQSGNGGWLEVSAGGGRQVQKEDVVHDLYAVPHTAHHHKVCHKPIH